VIILIIFLNFLKRIFSFLGEKILVIKEAASAGFVFSRTAKEKNFSSYFKEMVSKELEGFVAKAKRILFYKNLSFSYNFSVL
jgi:hypothetical protein